MKEREEEEREAVVHMEPNGTRRPEYVGAQRQRQDSSSSSSTNECEQKGGSVLLLSTVARFVSLTSFRSTMTVGVCLVVTIIGVLCTIQLRPSTGIPQLFPSEHNIQVSDHPTVALFVSLLFLLSFCAHILFCCCFVFSSSSFLKTYLFLFSSFETIV